MERQNITVSLPRALLKKAKSVAALEDKSLSQLLRESLEERVRGASGFRVARARQKRTLQTGFDLGTRGEIATNRYEIHGR